MVKHRLPSNVMHRYVANLAPEEAAFNTKCIFSKLSDALSRSHVDYGFIMFIHSLLYTTLVWFHLEYADTVLSPYKQYLIKIVEKVQKRATKLVHECKHLPYTDRLKYLKLPTLKYRTHRGDIVATATQPGQ